MPSHQDLANAIRVLAMDAVQQANSGHPGMPMGMADLATVLWRDFLQHDPRSPDWPNRDRFILSNGHGSMLQYALLHLSGYDVSIEDLKAFRQLHSKTPGHPEYGDTPGVETTTGPLGQGLANAVGMAIAERTLAAQFNQPGHDIIDHHTYVFLGDGCLMEGVSHEVCSLAGTLGLGKLIAVWDDNHISIDGEVDGWFSDDTPERFRAYGWHVISEVDGHDSEAIHRAFADAKAESARPTLICARTTIAYGAPNLAGTAKSHGAPLGDNEIMQAREKLGWQHEPFHIPREVYAGWDCQQAGRERHAAWDERLAAYETAHPELARELKRRLAGDLPVDFEAHMQALQDKMAREGEKLATRKASLQCIEHMAPLLPEFLGGSADLSGSNLTKWSDAVPQTAKVPAGNYLHYGVREFGMFAIMNGLALHGGFMPFGGTFLIFVEYGRNAVRMAALMKQRCIFVLTHDSVGLGEDGPTHQPIAQIAGLRATPNVAVWRPCDGEETAVAWRMAAENVDGPTCLALSRQGLPAMTRSDAARADIAKGGYILQDSDGTPDGIVIATGSEVSLALEAAQALRAEGHNIRVVSMPCVEVFLAQTPAYQERVLPRAVVRRVAVEAGASQSWYQFVGLEGRVMGLDTFGVSAPGNTAFEALGMTSAGLTTLLKNLLEE